MNRVWYLAAAAGIFPLSLFSFGLSTPRPEPPPPKVTTVKRHCLRTPDSNSHVQNMVTTEQAIWGGTVGNRAAVTPPTTSQGQSSSLYFSER